MKLKILMLIFLIGIFLLGWKTNELLADIGEINFQNPLNEGFFKAKSVNNPQDHIKKENIKVYNDKVIIEIENAMWAEFADTRSMEPVLSSKANSIEIKPKTIADIHLGDIISYKPENFKGLIIHRVIEIGLDNGGWYAITKGDNLSTKDPEKIRFEQVHGIVVAIIY